MRGHTGVKLRFIVIVVPEGMIARRSGAMRHGLTMHLPRQAEVLVPHAVTRVAIAPQSPCCAPA